MYLKSTQYPDSSGTLTDLVNDITYVAMYLVYSIPNEISSLYKPHNNEVNDNWKRGHICTIIISVVFNLIYNPILA